MEDAEGQILKTLKPEDIVSIEKPVGAVISPDGKWVAYALNSPVIEEEKSEYRSHIWMVSTENGESFQLTNAPDSDSDPQWSPDSKKIAFVSKRNDEKRQIWVISISGGEGRQLTHSKNDASCPRWSPDGKHIAFLMPEKDSEAEEKRKKAKDDPVIVEKDDFKRCHLWMIDLETINEKPKLLFTLPEKDSKKIEKDKSHRLTEGEFHVMDPQWSPDGKQIVYVSAPSPIADDTMFKGAVHILNVETKAIRKLTSHIGGENTPRWSPDGQHLAFLYRSRDDNPLQKDIYIIPSEGGKPINLTREFDHNEIMMSWSPKGDIICFETFDGVRRHLYTVSKDNGKIRQLTQGDCCNFTISIADDGDTFLCYGETPKTPVDLWVGSIKTGELRQITNLNPQTQDFAFGETRIVKWKSEDGLVIEGLLCLPVGYEEGKKYSLIVEPHGGPHGAIALGFFPFWQYFSGEGFATFSPNFRGSDGYGGEFAKGNYGNWGLGDYQDVMTGVDYLINEGIADPDRLLVCGWSYGGYMTAWMVTQTDRFKAACNGAGLSNLVSMYAQHDIPSFMDLYFKDSSPYQKMEMYRKHSPISYIHQAKTPTLILHGGEDKRVPVPQAEEFYAGLKAVGVEVEFVKYPREGHTIQEPRHIIDILKRKLEWFRKYI